jgi:cytochrome c oxidase subunit 2
MTVVRPAFAPPITDEAESIEDVWALFLWIGLGVLALVTVLVLWVSIRYRRRDDRLPRQKHYNIPMEVAYTTIPFLVVCALFAVTFVTVRAIEDTDADPDLVVHVVGYQWSWQFDYPGEGVTIVDEEDDENPVLVLPASSTVRFDLESVDVIHSFWLIPFRFKQDMIPGNPDSFRVDIGDTVGDFPNAGVCAEFCGLDHARMQFHLRVLSPEDFDQWLVEQRAAGGVVS